MKAFQRSLWITHKFSAWKGIPSNGQRLGCSIFLCLAFWLFQYSLSKKKKISASGSVRLFFKPTVELFLYFIKDSAPVFDVVFMSV